MLGDGIFGEAALSMGKPDVKNYVRLETVEMEELTKDKLRAN